ncbi:MAG: methyl-accepting chemotaxis protein [Oligoflexia bacterium]|nr:methyl-accepting chemotaxis protein [Oligoflexia bacterium]
MFKVLSVRVKLLLAFASVPVCLLLAGLVCWNGMNRVVSRYERAVKVNLDKTHKWGPGEQEQWVAEAKDAEAAATSSNILAGTLGGISFLGCLLLGYFFSEYLSKQLQQVADTLSENSESMTGTTRHVSEAGNMLSKSATEHAAALQETVSAIEQVSAMVQKNTENAKRSEQVSNASQETVLKGKRAVDSMVRSIEDIRNSNNDIMNQIEISNQQIADIVKVISEIGTKTKVINDIVFQTKLLSFNASVEAARAGEHGKGFAVVAEEVGNLAHMSGNAAKEISQMLEGSIRKVEGIVNETKGRVQSLVATGKEKVENGTNTAQQCGLAFDEIVKNVTLVNQLIAEIAGASREQAQGVQEINKAMNLMDQVTQTNAKSAQEVASGAASLQRQADSLRSRARQLQQLVTGGASVELPPAVMAHVAVPPPFPQNVVPIKKTAPAIERPSPRATQAASRQKATGTDGVPDQNDPRFEDI